jgi:hypothetical protein
MLTRVIVVLKDGKPAYFVQIPEYVLKQSNYEEGIWFSPGTKDTPDRWTVDGAEIDGGAE